MKSGGAVISVPAMAAPKRACSNAAKAEFDRLATVIAAARCA